MIETNTVTYSGRLKILAEISYDNNFYVITHDRGVYECGNLKSHINPFTNDERQNFREIPKDLAERILQTFLSEKDAEKRGLDGDENCDISCV